MLTPNPGDSRGSESLGHRAPVIDSEVNYRLLNRETSAAERKGRKLTIFIRTDKQLTFWGVGVVPEERVEGAPLGLTSQASGGPPPLTPCPP